MYTGVWVTDIPKCGTMEDFGRHEAPTPTTYPIPEVSAQFCDVSDALYFGE